MHKSLCFAVSFAVAFPVYAADLSDRYRSVGTFEGTIDGKEVIYTAVFDTERDRSKVQLRDGSGFTTVSIRASEIGDDGAPGKTGISFLVGPIMQALPPRMDVDVFGKGAHYSASADLKNRVEIEDLVLEDGKVAFSLDAELLPVKRDGYDFVPDPEGQPIQVQGAFSGETTDMD